MKRISIFFAALFFSCASDAWGHSFEFCDLQGRIASVEEHPNGVYRLVVNVSRASRTKGQSRNDANCQQLEGKPLDVSFEVSDFSARQPVTNDRIWFQRSVITIGYYEDAKTSIKSSSPVLGK